MSQKSILLIMPYGSVGGMERLALSFYNHYKHNGYKVKALKFIKLKNDIITFGKDELYFSQNDLSEMTKKERIKFYFNAPFLINKLIKKHNITHSIAFGDMANLFSSLSFSKEFKIGSIHALKSVELKHKTAFNKISKLGYSTSYRFLNKLVCISKAIKEDLLENCNYKFNNIEVIYNPHDIKEIVSRSKEPITDPEEITIFNDKTILFLGRLSIQKAPWHLIKAFKLVLDKFPNANLVLIGDGDPNVTSYIKELIETLNISNRVKFLGRRKNPYKYLSKVNVLALSSYYEGTPNVIVEAISLSTPIVSSNCTKGIEELMSTKSLNATSNSNLEVEAGIITPNFFKGDLSISKNTAFINEEKLFAEALIKNLETDNYKIKLNEFKEELLNKFDLISVSKQYLSH